MSTTRTRDSLLDAFDELSAALAGAGILTVALFPLALPLIALTTVVAIAFALMAVVAAGIVAVVAGPPVLVIRWLARPAGRAWLSRHETRCGIPIVGMLAVLAMPAGADGRARLFHFNACGSTCNHGTVDPVAGAIAAALVEFRPQAVSLNEMCRTQYRALLRRVRAAAASRRTAAARSTTCSSRPATSASSTALRPAAASPTTYPYAESPDAAVDTPCVGWVAARSSLLAGREPLTLPSAPPE